MNDDDVPISNEMIAAGIEAMDEALEKNFGKAAIIRNIYEAMYGEALKNYRGYMETVH